MNITPEQEVTQLIIACESLRTEDRLRNAEINNLLAVIYAVRDQIKEGIMDASESDIELFDVSQRINKLAADPKHAGDHEQYRPAND